MYLNAAIRIHTGRSLSPDPLPAFVADRPSMLGAGTEIDRKKYKYGSIRSAHKYETSKLERQKAEIEF